MKLADFNKGTEGKCKAVFVIFYSTNWQPWKNYIKFGEEIRDLYVPTCLMINRWDGCIGFIGGRVDDCELLDEAAIREVKEEIGYEINEKLEPLVAYDIGKITTHVYTVKLDINDLLSLKNSAEQAEDFNTEVTGIFTPHLIDYNKVEGRYGGLYGLFRMEMAPSVREEFTHFLIDKDIISKSELTTIIMESGYNIDELYD